MAKQKGRKGQRNRSTRNAEAVFFLDGRNTVNKPRVVTGKVADFDLDYNEFTVIMHSGAKTTFSTADWDELVFGSKEKAQALANKLPEVGRVAYLLDKEKRKLHSRWLPFTPFRMCISGVDPVFGQTRLTKPYSHKKQWHLQG